MTVSLLPLVLLALALPAAADAYKCKQADGKIAISTEPCTDGSSLVKAVPDDTVPEADRERAEREAERQRVQADRNESARQEKERQEREERDRAEQRQQANAPGAAEPVYVPVPYYVSPGYVRPPQRPRPESLPATPAKRGKANTYKSPDNYRAR